MTDPIEDYKYLLALHLRDISKRYGILYYDVLRGKMPEEVQGVYAEGLARVFDYMSIRHGLEMSDIMAVHETVMETALTEFVAVALHNSVVDNPQALH
ncbi:hypothetical protein [Sporomusa sp.]|uniref:hypothetical protein n=1 Tax=Sporomusa sp. TaxID=2078658 RepID=UPI002C2A9EF8|nr:hypothetical protein [Sporomusa sp.]HWR44824.1 hypothetical protein [Sporomusa sp.]